LLAKLGKMKLTHLLVEPGPRLAATFLQQNLADRVWVIRSPRPLNEPDAPRAIAVPFPATASRTMDDDLLSEHLNPASPVFFHAAPSPEFGL
jgi:riboflavin biosynthesis pyrimidine reductase